MSTFWISFVNILRNQGGGGEIQKEYMNMGGREDLKGPKKVLRNWFIAPYFIAAMFARAFDFFMCFLWCFTSDQFAYFIFRICTCTRILDSFMHFPFVFFKMSYYSCFKAAMFALVLDSFMHWLFAFWLSSCYVAAMFARVFHIFMSFLPVFCKCSIYSCVICVICTRKLDSFMHLFFVFF